MPASQERLLAKFNDLVAKSNARGSYFSYRVMTVFMNLSTNGSTFSSRIVFQNTSGIASPFCIYWLERLAVF